MRKTSPKLLQELQRLAATGITQQAAAAYVGKTISAVRTICCRYGIGPWPIGAAARDQRGDKNPNYKNGLSRATINRLTKSVLIAVGKDLFTCERCGHTATIELPRHHKDRNRANNASTNLEVLCIPCHNKEHMQEKRRRRNGTFIS